ncbi:hypothetical protein HAX54_010853, partial [Datura stramonium]|nr:hypothetical protein [Datura stramonium]
DVVFKKDTFPFYQTQSTHVPIFPLLDISLDTSTIQLTQRETNGTIGEVNSPEDVQAPE